MPYQQMLAFNKKYPESKEIYRQMQAWKLKNADKLCFFPSSHLYAIAPKMAVGCMRGYTDLTNFHKMPEQAQELLGYFWGLHLFGTWRNTLSVYRIDGDILNDTLKSPIPTETPCTIFARLPEWGVYMDLSHAQAKMFLASQQTGEPVAISGFWALYDRYTINNQPQDVLHLMLNLQGEGVTGTSYDQLQPIALILKDGNTVGEQTIQTIQHYQARFDGGKDSLALMIQMQGEQELLTRLLSCLLWLCADEPHTTTTAGEPISRTDLKLPRYAINKKTGAFVVPTAPTFIDVGKRFGSDFRQQKARLESERGDQSRTPSRKRPHIRKAHWHGYWKGTGQAREFFYKWQPTVFVNTKTIA